MPYLHRTAAAFAAVLIMTISFTAVVTMPNAQTFAGATTLA